MDLTGSIKVYQKENNHIEIVNHSLEVIKDLKLHIDSPTSFLQLEVVRDRGSLLFTRDLELIQLGNLSPKESAHLYYELTSCKNPTELFNLFLLYLDTKEKDGIPLAQLLPKD
jgi:hypothetical protein